MSMKFKPGVPLQCFRFPCEITICLVYVVAASAWTYFFGVDWLFVALSAVFLFLVLRRIFVRLRSAQKELSEREGRSRYEAAQGNLLLELCDKARGMSDQELYGLVLDHAVSLTGSKIGFLCLISDGQVAEVVWNDGALKACSTVYEDHLPLEQAGNWVDCIHLKQPVVYNDFPNSPNQRGLPEGHAPVTRFMGIPVLEGGKVRIVIGVGNKAGEYDDHDVVQIQLVAGELHKIIEHRHDEHAYRESAERLQLATEAAQTGIWDYDLESGSLVWDEQMHKLYGMVPGDFSGRNDAWLGALHPDDSARVADEVGQAIQGEKAFDTEYRVVWPDGSVHHIRAMARVHRNATGRAVRAVGTNWDITGQKQIAGVLQRETDALRKSEDKFRGLVESTSDWIWEVDALGVYTYVSPRIEAILGYKPEEVVGKTPFDFMPPDKAEQIAESFRDLVKTRSPIVALENANLHKDGRRIDIETNGVPVFDSTGGIVGYCGMDRDITGQKQMESALRQERELLSEAQRIAHIGSWRLDVESGEVEWSVETARIYGRDQRDSFSLAGFLDLVHPNDLEKTREAYARALESTTPGELVLRLVFDDGTTKHICERYETVFDDNGKPVRLVGTVQDITSLKQAEEELQEARQQLQFIVDNTRDIIFQIDLEGNYIYANAAAEGLTGYPMEELLKMNMLELVAPECHQLVAGRLRQRIAGETDDSFYSFEIAQKDGQRIWIELSTSPVLDDAGQLMAVQGVARDITERKKLADALEKRVLALTRPDGQIGDIGFEDLFNLEEIQIMQDQFASATGVASIITCPDGTPITQPSNFTRLCRDVIRQTEKGCANCYKSDAVLGRYHPEGPVIQPCMSGGLWDAGACITVGGQHIANWLIGQVRDETQTEGAMREYAREIAADEQEFMEAFAEVPSMSQEQFVRISDMLFALAQQLSTSAYMNLQQARFIAEEEERTEELQRLSTAIDQSVETVVITDSEGMIEYVNPAFESITGYTCEEAIGKNPNILQSGHHDDAFYKEIWERISSGKIWKGILRNKRKDGSFYTEDATISPVRNAAGDIVNYVAVKRDITEQLTATEELHRLSAAINQSAEIVVITDPEGMIEYVNPAFEAISGYSCEEAIGQNPRILQSGLHAAAFYKEIWASISRGESWEGRFHNKRKDGSLYIEDATISPVRNAGGTIINYVGVKRDITKELQLMEQVGQSQKMAAIGHLAGGVAHEFNNVLQTILGVSEILLDGMEEETPQHTDVEEVRAAARRAATLTRQLLDLGRKRKPECVALDINKVVMQSERAIRLLTGSNIELVFDLDNRLEPIQADTGKIGQVVLNLAINACDAMLDGGRLLVSTKNMEREGIVGRTASQGAGTNHVCLCISDTGCGIADEIREHLFEPFFTTKEVGEGTGLGLSVVYGIVEQHGGWIEVLSTPGEGTAFECFFPVCQEILNV